MGEVIQATDDDLARASGGLQFETQWVGKAVHRGRLVEAIGGAFEIEHGVWFGFMEVPAQLRRPSVFRHVRHVITQAREKGATILKATCDADIPRAKEMMQRLGFEPTEEEINGKVIWCLDLKRSL